MDNAKKNCMPRGRPLRLNFGSDELCVNNCCLFFFAYIIQDGCPKMGLQPKKSNSLSRYHHFPLDGHGISQFVRSVGFHAWQCLRFT